MLMLEHCEAYMSLTNRCIYGMYNGHAFYSAANGHLSAKYCLTARLLKGVNVRFRPLTENLHKCHFFSDTLYLMHLVNGPDN